MAQKYIVSGTLNHGVELPELGPDGRHLTRIDVYHDGETFETEDAALERELRATKTILLPEEYAADAASQGNPAAMEQLAAQRQAQADEIERLRAELEQLKAAQATATPPSSASSASSKGGKSGE